MEKVNRSQNNIDNQKRPNKSNFKLPEDVKTLVKLTEKKFKKKSDDFYESKKELREGYYSYIIDLLPDAISMIVKYGYKPELKEVKEEIYDKIVDEKFVKYLTKEIKKNDLQFDNMILLPILISEIVAQAEAANRDLEPGEAKFEVEDLVELSHLILKKKIKKMVKAGIDEAVAFDVLSIIPDPRILVKSAHYHFRKFFQCLYEHGKTKSIDFETLVDVLFKNNESFEQSMIVFTLLERKEKIANFNQSQNTLFNKITTWTFNTLESYKKKEIEDILTVYVKTRKKDDAQNKDTNRRYYISSLLEEDYPKIIKVVKKMLADDPNIKKYF